MRDHIGLVFVGLAVLFLVAILVGHNRRERFTNQTNVWDSIRVETETELAKKYVFDLSKFRAAVLNQNDFFDESTKDVLEHTQKALNVPMGIPDLTQIKDENKLFDEKIRIMNEELAAVDDISYANIMGLAIESLRAFAKTYMIVAAFKTGTVSAKTTADTLSTSVSSSVSNLLGY